ncbi:MAG TPA: nuclear transport factor 2 family protein [Ktedonobacterales bacterium]|nr:nuclear transport factor 2 family protein [Ktedonobacterales bacterium]
MTHDEITQIIERFAKVWSEGDADLATRLFAPDATYAEPPRFAFTGREDLRRFFADFFARHTAVSFVVTRAIIAPDARSAALAWTFAHTRNDDGHRAAYQGMSIIDITPDGLIGAWQGISMPTPDDGKP